MRTLLANLLKERDEEISLINIGDYIPDTYIEAQMSQVLNENSLFNQLPFQFLKTHDPYLPFYKNKKVIYIIRDGRDALNSYYYYLNARLEKPITVCEIINFLFMLLRKDKS